MSTTLKCTALIINVTNNAPTLKEEVSLFLVNSTTEYTNNPVHKEALND